MDKSKATYIICMYCHWVGNDEYIDDFKGIGYCIKCKSFYKYDQTKNEHIEIKEKDLNE